MRSLTCLEGRHVTVDRRDDRYLAFPDIAMTKSGRLLCAYRESDRHVAAWSRLLIRHSDDLGKTWSESRVVNPFCGHMPRLTVLDSGEILLIDDGAPPHNAQDAWTSLYRSWDDGERFSGERLGRPNPRLVPDCPTFAPDRILALGEDDWICLAQVRLCVYESPQHTFCVLVYRSKDQGHTWVPDAIAACEPQLRLCECSAVKLADGRILVLYRVNSACYEPTYYNFSEDGGRTFSALRAAPFVGHRPAAGLTRAGKLLVTYRNVAPGPGTCAWMGAVSDLGADFQTEGWLENPALATLEAGALSLGCLAGAPSRCRFVLRPLTDPRYATARLSIGYDATGAGGAFGVQFGGKWHPLSGKGTLTLTHTGGGDGEARAVYLGTSAEADRGGLSGALRLTSVDYEAHEPRFSRDYAWSWNAGEGMPQARASAGRVELAAARSGSLGDMGYSSWVQLPDGRYLCAYHHIEPGAPHSYVRCTSLEDGDFS